MGCATATAIGTALVGGRACVGCGNMSGAGRSEARACCKVVVHVWRIRGGMAGRPGPVAHLRVTALPSMSC
eukprot:5827912-Pleurochrysis_carterae.AAC.1